MKVENYEILKAHLHLSMFKAWIEVKLGARHVFNLPVYIWRKLSSARLSSLDARPSLGSCSSIVRKDFDRPKLSHLSCFCEKANECLHPHQQWTLCTSIVCWPLSKIRSPSTPRLRNFCPRRSPLFASMIGALSLFL